MAEKEHEDNTWFKKFMGMPEPGNERREKIHMWITIVIAFAVILGAMYLVGCKAECVRSCQSTMEACFDGAKTSEEREQCMTNNAACANGCTQGGTRIHWELKEKNPAEPMKKIKPVPPKESEKPSDDLDSEGFEEE